MVVDLGTGWEVPSPELDRYLDAMVRCVSRFGLRRTSVQDVARELGVDRTTVYRQAGTIDDQLRMVIARDIHQLMRYLPGTDGRPVGAGEVVEAMASIVDEARAHPLIVRLREDDGDAFSLSDLQHARVVLARAAEVVAPLLASGMELGWFAARDPAILANWLVGTVVWLVLMMPEVEARPALAEIVTPMLQPAQGSA